MKAAVYHQNGPPSVLRLEEIPDPVCAPDGVVLDVKAISIEGGDTLNRLQGVLTSRPHVVGYQCAGVIREAGASVTDRAVGDRVVALMPSGSHAERVALHASQTWRVPDALSLDEASTVPVPFGTADDCLFEFGKLKAGETVLIQAGAGGVGLAAIQLAKRAGARVLATASSPQKLERLREFGLDDGIDYRASDFVAVARALTNGRGVDLVVDSVGGRTLQGSLETLAYRGRCITVGRAGRDATPPSLEPLSMGNRSLTGYFLGAEVFASRDRVRAMIDGHLRDLSTGALRMPIDSRFPLADAAAAHARAESRQAFGRVLLIP